MGNFKVVPGVLFDNLVMTLVDVLMGASPCIVSISCICMYMYVYIYIHISKIYIFMCLNHDNSQT